MTLYIFAVIFPSNGMDGTKLHQQNAIYNITEPLFKKLSAVCVFKKPLFAMKLWTNDNKKQNNM